MANTWKLSRNPRQQILWKICSHCAAGRRFFFFFFLKNERYFLWRKGETHYGILNATTKIMKRINTEVTQGISAQNAQFTCATMISLYSLWFSAWIHINPLVTSNTSLVVTLQSLYFHSYNNLQILIIKTCCTYGRLKKVGNSAFIFLDILKHWFTHWIRQGLAKLN